jgi:nucleotide-binding universal stress UspA family protein
VVLLAVVEPSYVPIAMDAGVGFVMTDQTDEYQLVPAEGSERLTKLGLAHKTSLAMGDPATCIVNAARAVHADLVAVGHHKSGRLARWLHESVTAALIESLDCSDLSGRMDVSDEALFGPATQGASRA